jgi:site-specific DNA-methyltransferase (adenine-specific)
MLASAFPGALVLDPFCGSGTTGVAAIDADAYFVGVDSSRHWIKATSQRLHAPAMAWLDRHPGQQP